MRTKQEIMGSLTPIQFIENIRELVGKAKLDQALKVMQEFLSNSPRLDEVLQQAGRYERVIQQIRIGIIKHEDANVDINRIQIGILELLRKIEEDITAKAELQDEAQQAISILERKNIIQNAEKIYNIEHINNANFS